MNGSHGSGGHRDSYRGSDGGRNGGYRRDGGGYGAGSDEYAPYQQARRSPEPGGYGTGGYPAAGYGSGGYPSGGSEPAGGRAPGGYGSGGYGSGGYETSGLETGGYGSGAYESGGYGSGGSGSGGYGSGGYGSGGYGSGGYGSSDLEFAGRGAGRRSGGHGRDSEAGGGYPTGGHDTGGRRSGRTGSGPYQRETGPYQTGTGSGEYDRDSGGYRAESGGYRTDSGGYRSGGAYRSGGGTSRTGGGYRTGSHRVVRDRRDGRRWAVVLGGAAAAIAVCVLAAFVVLSGVGAGDDDDGGGQVVGSATGGSPTSKGERSAVPDSCTIVGQDVIDKLAPGSERTEADNYQSSDRQNQCVWGAYTGKNKRQLTVELRAIAAANGRTATDTASATFASERSADESGESLLAGQKLTEKKRLDDVGDDGYVVYSVDKGQGSAEAIGNVRLGNVLITIHYSGSNDGDPLSSGAATDGAVEVARAVIQGLDQS